MTIFKHIPVETLIIDRWYSRCNNCGFDCDPYEKEHLTNLGYDEEIRKTPGCGVKWTHITSGYIGFGVENSIMAMRPDLIFIDPTSGVELEQ